MNIAATNKKVYSPYVKDYIHPMDHYSAVKFRSMYSGPGSCTWNMLVVFNALLGRVLDPKLKLGRLEYNFHRPSGLTVNKR